MRSWPPSGEGLTSGVANADRCDIVTAFCDPASFSSGLPLATPWSHAFVAAWRSFDEALVTPNSMPCVNTVCPLSSPYPFCGTTLTVSYTHLRAHETPEHLVCRLLLEKKKKITTH